MSRRSRRRRAEGKKPWMVKAALAIVGLAALAMVVGYISLSSYLHGDGFRKFLSGKVSQAAGVTGEFSPFEWHGMALDTAGFEAAGEGRVKSVKAQGLHTEVSLGGVKRGVWEIRNTVMDHLDVSLDTQEQTAEEEKPDPPAVKRARKSPWLPDEAELTSVDLRDFTVRALSSSGLAVASGMRVKAEKSGRDSYQAEIHGGEFRLPWKHVPTMTLDHARVRWQDGVAFISESQLDANGGGRVVASGEWDTKAKVLDIQGNAAGFRCENVLTGDWAKRLSGDVSSTFDLRGKNGNLSSSGEMIVTNGTLTALPMLDALAAYADTRRFRVLNLSEAHTRWQWEKGALRLTNLVLASEGLVRLEGSLEIRDGRLDGHFMLGIAPGVLAAIPGAEEDVFLPGERSLLWAPLRVTGTLKDPEEDLTGRLIAAAGARMFEVLPETGAQALKFSRTVLGDSADRTIEKGEKFLKKNEGAIREASGILKDLLGK